MKHLGCIQGTKFFQDSEGDVWASNQDRLDESDLFQGRGTKDAVCIFFKVDDATEFCTELLALLKGVQQ